MRCPGGELAGARGRGRVPVQVPDLAKGGMEKGPVEVGTGVSPGFERRVFARARVRAHRGEHARALRTVPGQPPLLPPESHAPPPQVPPFPSPWGHVRRGRCPRDLL